MINGLELCVLVYINLSIGLVKRSDVAYSKHVVMNISKNEDDVRTPKLL